VTKQRNPFSRIDHMGFLVRDLDKAIKDFESLGIGPFQEIEMETIVYREMYGKPADWRLRAAVVKIDPGIKIELIQPLEKADLLQDFLTKKGEGINHVAFAVEDLDKEVAKLQKRGLKPIFIAKRSTGHGGVYFDTRETGGTIFELIQWWPEVL
jgi:methylmalonyl-CoA/ethylmalonyl-CoA epimerase